MGYYLAANKEVYAAVLYAPLQAVKRLGQRETIGRNFTVFADAQAAPERCRNDHAGPEQDLAKAIVRWSRIIWSQGNTLTLRWVPHLRRKITERTVWETKDRIDLRIDKRWDHLHPLNSGL